MIILLSKPHYEDELVESFVSPTVICRGLQKLVMKNITYGLGEMYRGVFIGAQVKLLQKFIPELSLSDVVR